MKTLKLNVDDLKVESFHTTPGDGKEGDGTIFGFDQTHFDKTCVEPCHTYVNTCPVTCATCATCSCETCGPTDLPNICCRYPD